MTSLLFILFFVFFWLGVSWLIGEVSGWRAISKVYPHKGPLPTEHIWKWQSIPNLALRNCVNIALDQEGMYFEFVIIYRFGNSSIFIPWSDISVSESKFFFIQTTKLTFKYAPGNFQFYKKLSEKMSHAAGNNWPQASSPK